MKVMDMKAWLYVEARIRESGRLGKAGFTAIEGLTALATITTFALLLYSLLDQAGRGRRQSQSLANVKQVGLVEIMYGNDNDGYFVLQGYSANLNAKPVSRTWVSLLRPYTKDPGILVDPRVGDNGGLVLGSKPGVGIRDRFVQYGYNYLFLSPWYACSSSVGRSSSVAIKPERTVMFTSSQNFPADPKRGWFDANAPGAWPVAISAPMACVWLSGGVKGSGNWSHKNPARIGDFTSTVRAGKRYGGAVVSWVDGHASIKTDVELAAGTDYLTASYDNPSEGAKITDLSKYLWTLDGTLKDLSL
jgi:hypothetical protein